jgi:hypothetical protein
MASSETANTSPNATKRDDTIGITDVDLSICLQDIFRETVFPEDAVGEEIDVIQPIHVWRNESRETFISSLEYHLSGWSPEEENIPEKLFNRYPGLRDCRWKVTNIYWKMNGRTNARLVESDILFKAAIRMMVGAGDKNEGRLTATMIPDLSTRRTENHNRSQLVLAKAASLLGPFMHCSFHHRDTAAEDKDC